MTSFHSNNPSRILSVYFDGPGRLHQECRPFVRLPGVTFDETHDPKAADYICCAGIGQRRQQDKTLYDHYGHKYVWWIDEDEPEWAYELQGIKFVAQPTRCAEDNRRHGIIVIPLTMAQIEWGVTQDRDFLTKCRCANKKYDFLFIGSTQNKPDRDFLHLLDLPNFHFIETEGIWNLDDDMKIKVVREFYESLAEAKFVFSPRGSGSSSFRLYQSLAVASVPVISGMIDYPFKELDWKRFSIIDDSHGMNYQACLEQYQVMSSNGVAYWDTYVYQPNLYRWAIHCLCHKLYDQFP